ncbi:hypothetical protein ABT324_00685 [Saccharopolyspora sp. NPDC000359]|uniref:hypothetical protein n=1 Tax=Saccharopolyspora sp. NPDC000359 TaxID=3154251 RepID=UPI00332BF72D
MSRPIICKVCERALDTFTNEDGATYQHTLSDLMDGSGVGHDPVPVAAPPEWRGRCDFCTDGVAGFVVPARAFTPPNTPMSFSSGDWAACEWCALLIEANRWQGVVKRAVNSFKRRMGFPMPLVMRTSLWELYRKLAENITGPIRPIEGGEST